MTAIDISRIHFPVTALGPGRRIGVWLQGCSIRCPGCISADTWAANRGRTSVAEVIAAVEPWIDTADGVTISGGEPFDQLDPLVELLRILRERFGGDVLVYSGYQFDDLAAPLVAARGLIDALLSGPFRHDLPLTLPLRGSDNQELHLLTPLGERRFAVYNESRTAGPARLDIMFDNNGSVWLAGIPRRQDFSRLRALLESNGHRVVTSEQRLKGGGG